MGALRNIAMSVVFMLIIVSQLFAFAVGSGPIPNAIPSDTADASPVQEYQSPVSSYLFAIQVSNSAQIITEVHKWGVLIVNPNQVVPFNFDFRSFAAYPVPTIYTSPVPIFIRGHALLN